MSTDLFGGFLFLYSLSSFWFSVFRWKESTSRWRVNRKTELIRDSSPSFRDSLDSRKLVLLNSTVMFAISFHTYISIFSLSLSKTFSIHFACNTINLFLPPILLPLISDHLLSGNSVKFINSFDLIIQHLFMESCPEWDLFSSFESEKARENQRSRLLHSTLWSKSIEVRQETSKLKNRFDWISNSKSQS